MLKNATKMNRLTEITSEAGLVLSKKYKKQENVWSADLSDVSASEEPLDLSDSPSDEDNISRWK